MNSAIGANIVNNFNCDKLSICRQALHFDCYYNIFIEIFIYTQLMNKPQMYIAQLS